jgi:hypothetical protein
MILQKNILYQYFGNKHPRFTLHALQRFTERIYHVAPEQYKGWIKLHHKEVYYDILVRLSNSVHHIPNEEHLKHIEKNYKNRNLKFLICNNLVFVLVVNDSIELVTCYLKDKDNKFFN